MKPWRPEKVISGGQTGADRGGLDAAIACGLAYGGWVPKGSRAEDGRVPDRYRMREHHEWGYAGRTKKNVGDSDATLVFSSSRETAGPGTRLTLDYALRARMPCLFIELNRGREANVRAIHSWLRRVRPTVLNVAGSRESTCPGIEVRVRDILVEVFEDT